MNATQTKLLLRNLPTKHSIMLAAKHGVGKSSVVRQAAEEEGGGFYDVRLSQCEVGDIKGLPYLDEENQRTRFLKPHWWPRDPNSKGILFFDELNRATKDVLQAVFEICLDRRLDGEPLPEGWRVVAAVNATDDYDVVEFDPALLDRWFYIDFEPTTKEWIKWASSNNVHPAIVDFIAQFEEYLDPPVGALEAGKVYQSRRSWVHFNEGMHALNQWESTDSALLHQLAQGWLGAHVALSFSKFFQNDFSRLKAEDVLDHFDDENVRRKVEGASSDIEVIASLSRNVSSLLKKRTPASLTPANKNNVKEFIQTLPSEVASQFWVDILSLMRKDIITWQKDDVFAEFIRKVYVVK